MNIRSPIPSLELQLAEALRVLLTSVTWLKGWKVEPDKDKLWDLRGSVPIPGGKAILCIECKRHFTPSQFPGLVNRPCQSSHKASTKVLAMPQVSPRLAELCEKSGWSWFDLAGNCKLNVAGYLSIERSGRKLARPQPRSIANLGTAEANRVIRALLAPENAGHRWTQRQMVGHFGKLRPSVPAPSLSLVNKVVQYLRDQAFIKPHENRGFQVSDYEALLAEWSAAYRFERHDRLKYFTLLKGKTLDERLRTVDPDGVGRLAYAVFSAADLQAPVVRQPRTWLYVEPEALSRLQGALEAKPVDSGENIVVLVPDDQGVFYRAERGGDRLATTNAVQTYLDLVHAGGRGAEAAEAVFNRCLKPAWERKRDESGATSGKRLQQPSGRGRTARPH